MRHRRILAGGAVGVLLVLEAGCSDVLVPRPSADPPPQAGPTAPPVVPSFPPVDSAATVYLRASATSFVPGHSRYVLFEDGTFALQYVRPDLPPHRAFFEYAGRYARAASALRFAFDGWSTMGPWLADGLVLGDSLIVAYNDVMLWADFEDGVYVRSPALELTTPATRQLAMVYGDLRVAAAGSRLPLPLAVRVTGGQGTGVPNVRVKWDAPPGAGELLSFPEERPLDSPFTATDADGVARVVYRPTVAGVRTVTASVPGLRGSPVRFTTSATGPMDVLIRFGPFFDCTPPNDPSNFVGPTGSSHVTARLGATVTWVYMEWVHPACTARVVSTLEPPGGKPFESGTLRPGQPFTFVPNVVGTWAFTDELNGGSGRLTVEAP